MGRPPESNRSPPSSGSADPRWIARQIGYAVPLLLAARLADCVTGLLGAGKESICSGSSAAVVKPSAFPAKDKNFMEDTTNGKLSSLFTP